MAARTASAMAQRGTRRSNGRREAPKRMNPLRQTVAENGAGGMVFDNEFMGGQQAKRNRTLEFEEQAKKPLALRQINYPIFATSAQADTKSADGSSFQVSTDKIPMRIPSSSTNVYASLLKASVPYKWPNYSSSESLVVQAEVPRTVQVGTSPIPNALTAVTTPPIIWDISNFILGSNAGAVDLVDTTGANTLARQGGNVIYVRQSDNVLSQSFTFLRLNQTGGAATFSIPATQAIGSALTPTTYAFTLSMSFRFLDSQGNYNTVGDRLITIKDTDASKFISIRTTGPHLELIVQDGSSNPKSNIIARIVDVAAGTVYHLSIAVDSNRNLEMWVNGVRTRAGLLPSLDISTLDSIQIGEDTSAESQFLMSELRLHQGRVLDFANLRSEHDELMRKYLTPIQAKTHLLYFISMNDIANGQSFRTDLATDLGALGASRNRLPNVAVRSHKNTADSDKTNFFIHTLANNQSFVEHDDTASLGNNTAARQSAGTAVQTFGNNDQNDESTFAHHVLGIAAEAEPNTFFFGYARLGDKSTHLQDIANRLKSDALDQAAFSNISDVSVIVLQDRHFKDHLSAALITERVSGDILEVFDEIRGALPNAVSKLYISQCSNTTFNTMADIMQTYRTDVQRIGSVPAGNDFTNAELLTLAQDMYNAISKNADGVKIEVETVKPTLSFSSSTTSASDRYATMLSSASFVLQSNQPTSFTFTGDATFEDGFQVQTITNWNDVTSGNAHTLLREGTDATRVARTGGNSYGVFLEGTAILEDVAGGTNPLAEMNQALPTGGTQFTNSNSQRGIVLVVDLSNIDFTQTDVEYFICKLFDSDGAADDGIIISLRHDNGNNQWKMAVREGDKSSLGGGGNNNRMSTTSADVAGDINLTKPFVIRFQFAATGSSPTTVGKRFLFANQLHDDGSIVQQLMHAEPSTHTVNPMADYDRIQLGHNDNPSDFKAIIYEVFTFSNMGMFHPTNDSDLLSSIASKYFPQSANPIVDIHSLDTTNYLTTVGSARTTKEVFVPPGSYSTVQSYIEKAETEINASLLSTSGVSNVVDLDLESTSLSGGTKVTYDLKASLNKVIDGNAFMSTEIESVAYGLVNERVNQSIDTFIKDQFANRTTIVQEAGNFVIVGDTSMTGLTWQCVLIIDKLTLTVYQPTVLGNFTHGSIAVSNMKLRSMSAGIDATGDAVCVFAFEDTTARYGTKLLNLTDNTLVHTQNLTATVTDSLQVAWDTIGKLHYFFITRNSGQIKLYKYLQSHGNDQSVTALDVANLPDNNYKCVSFAIGRAPDDASGANSLLFCMRHQSNNNDYKFEFKALAADGTTETNHDSNIPAIVNTAATAAENPTSEYHDMKVRVSPTGNLAAITFPGNHASRAVVVFDLRTAQSYAVKLEKDSPGHGTYGEPTDISFHKVVPDNFSVCYSKGSIETYSLATGTRNHFFKVIPDPTGGALGFTNFVVTQVTNSVTLANFDHTFFVGDFASYLNGGATLNLSQPDILHRTSAVANAEVIASFFENRELPTQITVKLGDLLQHLDEGSSSTAQISGDMLQDARVESSFDLFPSDQRPTDQLSQDKSFTIPIPSGSYSPQTLVDTINLEIIRQDSTMPFPLLSVLNFAALEKLSFASDLSLNFQDNFPRKVTLTYNKTSSSDITTIKDLASLIGWDLSTGDIVLTASSNTPRTVYSGVLSNKYNFDQIKNLFLLTNFARSGLNTLREPSQILAKIPVNVEQGQLIVSEPSVPLRVNAYDNLRDGEGTRLEFSLVDENGTPINIGASTSWSVNVLIEWEQDIDPTRLMQSQTDTKFA